MNGRARCDELGDWAVMIITECARAIGKKGCKVSGGEPRLGGSWGCKSTRARDRAPRPHLNRSFGGMRHADLARKTVHRRRSARARLGRERGHGTKRQLHGKCDSQRRVCLDSRGASRCARGFGGHCQRESKQTNRLCLRLSRTSSLSRPSKRMGLGVEGGVKCLALSLARRILAGKPRSLARGVRTPRGS